MNAILINVLVGAVSAAVTLCTYILIRKMILKGQKEAIIKKAEVEAESIKKEKIFQAKEKFLQLKSEHEQFINEKNKHISDIENRLKQKETVSTSRTPNLDVRIRRLKQSERISRLRWTLYPRRLKNTTDFASKDCRFLSARP